MDSTNSTIASLNEKLDGLASMVKEDRKSAKERREEQRDFNARIVVSIENLATTVSKVESFQVEMNHQDKRITLNATEISKVRERQNSINDKVITITTLTDGLKHINKVALGVFVAAIVGGGYLTNSNNADRLDKSDLLIHAMEAQAKAMAKISEELAGE